MQKCNRTKLVNLVKSAYQRSPKQKYLVTKCTNQYVRKKADNAPRPNNLHTFAIYGLILGYQKELQIQKSALSAGLPGHEIIKPCRNKVNAGKNVNLTNNPENTL